MVSDGSSDFFRILGYLASDRRNAKIDVETHPNSRGSVERDYFSRTGEELVEDDVNYFVWEQSANKWGAELRIYFKSNPDMPSELLHMVRAGRPGSSTHNARVNNSEFVWSLIKYGFRASDFQDESIIRSKVPSQFLQDYEDGLDL